MTMKTTAEIIMMTMTTTITFIKVRVIFQIWEV